MKHFQRQTSIEFEALFIRPFPVWIRYQTDQIGVKPDVFDMAMLFRCVESKHPF